MSQVRLTPFGWRGRAVQFVLCGWLGFLGCACSGGISRQEVHPARGKVLFEGKPVVGALIQFHPVDNSSPNAPRPRARSGTDGTFEVSTYAAGDGAPAGRYLVTVSLQSGEEDDRPKSAALPLRYAQTETSDLRIGIRPGTNELQPFVMKK